MASPVESTAISRPRPPDLIPGYKLEKLVGKGGMGEVYRGVQNSLGRPVAIKLLAPELVHDQAFVTRFEKEAAALAALSHPHVVSIVDKGKHKDTYFLVMEFVGGPSLREMIRSPLLDTAGALRIALQICRAIDYAHGRGVIHRDLKPENILLDEQAGGIPKVTDFGLAAFQTQDAPSKFNLTETHVSMGTLSYMAPEQRQDAKKADHRADLYSLGVILYELLTGELPIGHYDPPSHKKSGVDKRLDAIVSRCLKPDPADRYPKVADLLNDLEPLVPISFSQRPRKLSTVERAKLAVERGVRRAIRIAGFLLVLAAAVVLLVAVLRLNGDRRGAIPTVQALGAELPPKGALEIRGRLSDEPALRSIVLGDGPDTISLVAQGRGILAADKALSFESAEPDAAVGRASIDVVDVDGTQTHLAAEVTTEVGPTGAMVTARRLILGAQPEPRSGLVLQGGPGRYAAVVMSGTGAPIALEWALGERRGTMLGPPSPVDGALRLELSVDRQGELRAFAGSGKDRRPVGEPVSLGPGWRKYFGKMPGASILCIEGGCQFRKLVFEVARDVPREPPPVVAPAPPPKPPTTARKPPTPHKKTTTRKR